MRRILFVLFFMLGIGLSNAQPSATYYDVVDGQKGAALKTALKTIIDDHTERTYKELWTDFRTTDSRPDGKVWDMYSGVTNYVFGDDQNTGNSGPEGTDYNREHAVPNSWFGGKVQPMYTDLFHMYPTDSYVNGMRANYPFGEVGAISKQSVGGFSKLGSSSLGGYSGIVFEPADEYKGDFARTYFYMVTRYEDQVEGWSSDMLCGNSYPAFTDWAINILLKWHRQDPVSEKELHRNNAVFSIQHNRNPFIDYPVFAEFLWGDMDGVVVDLDKLVLYSNEYDASDVLIQCSDSNTIIGIYDLSGRRVQYKERGLYIVSYLRPDGSVFSRKEVR